MKQVLLFLGLTFFSVSMLLGQVSFSHAANSTNTSGHITTLNHPSLNNNPNAVVFVSPVWEMNGDQNPIHTFGVWYNGSRWTIFNQNRTAMDMSAGKIFRFNVLAFSSSTSSTFVHTVTSSNKNAHITTLDHPSINNNPDAAITVTQIYGVYNTHEIGVWYNNGRWTIFNQDRVELPLNATFNVLIGTGGINGATSIQHTHTDASKLGEPHSGYTILDYPAINNKSYWSLFVTQRWIGTYYPHVFNIWYDDPNPSDPYHFRDGKWFIYSSNAMPNNTTFNILAVPSGNSPMGCAELASSNYERINLANIQSVQSCLTATRINGSNNENNRLRTGAIIFYRTNEGRLGKMEILEYAYNIRLRCTTYNENGTIYRQNDNLTIRGTWSCDLDNALEASGGQDFFWEQNTAIERYLTPRNNATFWIAKSGSGSTPSTCAELPNATYETVNRSTIQTAQSCLTATRINGSNNEGNRLRAGTILFYRTSEGRLGKMEILEYAYNIRLRCTTYNENGTVYRQNDNLTIRGTWSCDLDNAVEAAAGQDFFWEQNTAVERYLTPRNNATYWVAKTGTGVPTPVTTLRGWVDMHTHPMSHLGFGKKLMHGAPDVGSIIPAGTRGCNPVDYRATSMEEALANCNHTHGGWGLDNGCGNYVRAVVISKAFDGDFVHNVDHNPFSGGNLHGDHRHEGIETNPNFLYWPHQSSKAHQQMWWEWIKRAYKEGGLRVMVALTVNSELLAEVIDGDNPKDDKSTSDLQIDEIKSFVGRHNDFMEVAYTASDLRRIVGADKLAVIIGMEVDNIGNFNKSNVTCNDATVKAEVNRLFDKGVRYIFPIHLVDNKFGGTAVYEDLFNFANKHSTGSLFTIQSSSTIDPTITHRLGAGLDGAGNLGVKAALDAASGIPFPPALNVNPFDSRFCPIPTLGCWDKFKFIQNLISPDARYVSYAATPGGHANAKGLTPLGEIAIKEMMRLGMLIDIDHMSQNSINRTLQIAESVQYPVNIGHNGIRERTGNERSSARKTAERVAQLGGMFGVGTSDSEEAHSDAASFIRNFETVWAAMGNKSVAMGTDVNGMERLPRASQGLNSTTFYSGFSPCRTGNRTWDYTKEGVAHYGLMADFVRDIKNRNAPVYENLMKSAEYFAQMWEKCERQKTSVR